MATRCSSTRRRHVRGKASGSIFEFYDAALRRVTLRKLTMVSELRAAIGSSALALHYQPQVDLAPADRRVPRRSCAGSIRPSVR